MKLKLYECVLVLPRFLDSWVHHLSRIATGWCSTRISFCVLDFGKIGVVLGSRKTTVFFFCWGIPETSWVFVAWPDSRTLRSKVSGCGELARSGVGPVSGHQGVARIRPGRRSDAMEVPPIIIHRNSWDFPLETIYFGVHPHLWKPLSHFFSTCRTSHVLHFVDWGRGRFEP